MNYYKSNSGEVFAYDAEQVAMGLADDKTPMTPEEIDAHLNPPPVVTVPDRVTMRQARLALHEAGLLSQVQTAIDSLQDPPKTAVQIEWDYSSEVHRNKEFVLQLGAILGLDSAALDALFVRAAQL
jgi:hypothetical protein